MSGHERFLLACGWEEVRPGDVAGGVREPGPRVQLLRGDAVPQAGALDTDQPRRGGDLRLLPDQLRSDRRAGRRGLFPRPVPANQSPALQGGLHHTGRRLRPLARFVSAYMALGREQHRLGWGDGGEIKFFMDGDGEFPTICGTGTEDYFCGSLQFRPRHSVDRTRTNAPTRNTARPTRACRRSSSPTVSTSRSSASACTAGTSPTRSASRAT